MEWPGRLEDIREVSIETRRSADAPAHSTPIWVVADDGDVFIRSWKGGSARWYREVAANQSAVLHFDKVSLPVHAVAATDADSVARASAALLRKYGPGRVADSMVRDEILDTTLRLEPAGPPKLRR